ncbi:MAG TPA: DbpA RNA binding domain-containing protein [Gemmatimonadaceae bacterium]|nr:DbpA RNA binding domain-containing protein [Gemmatimonadaceae bacterium]
MEADAKEPAGAGITRGQNAVHVVPMDWPTLARVLAPALERLDTSRGEPQLLVVTADAESAVAAATALVAAASGHGLRVLAATPGPRAARLLRASSAQIVAGAPADLVALLQSSALKPDALRVVALAWLDVMVGSPDAQPLETLLGELPKEGARIVLATELSPAYEALIERYARRARREVEPASEGAAPLSVEYVTAPATGRTDALRRLLDALDLPSAGLYARDDRVRDQAARVARALGYPDDAVRTARSADEAVGADPIVLLDLPASREEMRALAGSGRKIYAIVQPSQLGSLRTLLSNGTLSPITLVDAAERARGKDAALRASLRDVLSSSDVRREVLAIEPLLAEFDGVEIAAAALRLLEQQKPARPATAATAAPPMTALFVNLGERDGVRPQELVAAVTSSAGLPTSQIGRIEVRDTHAIVEVAASVAELVAGKLTGSVVRGRRVQARVDTPREARGGRSDRPPRPGAPRGGPRGVRGDRRDRGDRGDRGDPGDRSDRGDRGDRFDRGERPVRPYGRDAGAKKPFDRGASERRPPRAAGPRSRRDDG